MAKRKLTGAEILWECLVREKVDVVFGYPGGAILPAYDALNKYKDCLLYTSPSPRDRSLSRMPSSA